MHTLARSLMLGLTVSSLQDFAAGDTNLYVADHGFETKGVALGCTNNVGRWGCPTTATVVGLAATASTKLDLP